MSQDSHASPDFSSMPPRVRRAVEFFMRQGIWHKLSRNSVATSCRDAAARRRRIGMEGIPVYDELRSFCAAVYYSDGSRRPTLFHCRANAHFDMEAAARLLGATKRIARLSVEELSKEGVAYGTVNPFSEAHSYIQVFDQDVLATYTSPHTMMTNAGDHTWAVEFRPIEVIEALKQESSEVFVGSITGARSSLRKMPVFGVITGNGPESGMALWRYLNEDIHTRLTAENRMRGDLSYPRVIIHSIPEMGLSMELIQREGEVWSVIHDAVSQMITCGVTHIAIACNTTQYFTSKIRELCQPGVEFISLVDVTERHMRSNKIQDVTIIGIPIVASLGEFSAYRGLTDYGLRAVDEYAQPYTEEMAYLVKRLDSISPDPKALNRLQHVIRSSVETSHILIALTEVSVLLERFPRLREKIGNKTIVDPLRLCGKEMAKIYLESLPDEDVQELPDYDNVAY